MKKYIIQFAAIIAMLFCCSCGVNRQQVSDSIAGIQAAQDLAVQGRAHDASLVLEAAIHYQLAAINLSPQDLPPPTMAPTNISQRPSEYADAAPPVPATSGGWWGAVAAGGVAILLGVRTIAPMVPGLGPLVGKVADLAYAAIASRDQRQSDKAAYAVAFAAQQVRPLLVALIESAPSLPPKLRAHLTPDRLAALSEMTSALAATTKQGGSHAV